MAAINPIEDMYGSDPAQPFPISVFYPSDQPSVEAVTYRPPRLSDVIFKSSFFKAMIY